MAPRLISAVLARNEAAPDRYLKRVLARCAEFSDAILLLDDGSTDDTAQVARDAGCIVETRAGNGFWGGSEAPARRELWERAAELAGEGWVLICDADMVLQGDPRPLCESWAAVTWCWPLADLWDNEYTFRVDGPWGHGANTPRPWLFRPNAPRSGFTPEWSSRDIHVGHAPANWHVAGPAYAAPPDVFWLHYGWMRREHRERKAAQYAAVAHTMSEFERAHAATILD